MADTTIYAFACEDDGERGFGSEVLVVERLRPVLPLPIPALYLGPIIARRWVM
jgi:hypothetical protein